MDAEAHALVAASVVVDGEEASSVQNNSRYSLAYISENDAPIADESVAEVEVADESVVGADTTIPDQTVDNSTTLPADTTTASMQKERNALTLNQRRSLRQWAQSQDPRPTHRACQQWFLREYGQSISQSTVSHSLSPKYSRLDTHTPQLNGSRLRFGNWPDVEKLVLKWYQGMVINGKHPSNEDLADKARDIYLALPQYNGEPSPEFSPGWIHRFKKRYGLLVRRHRRHSEADDPTTDLGYIAECLMSSSTQTITQTTSPATMRQLILRHLGFESSLSVCALARDEIVRRQKKLPSGTLAISVAAAEIVAQQISERGNQPQQSVSISGQSTPVVNHNVPASAAAGLAAAAQAAVSVAAARAGRNNGHVSTHDDMDMGGVGADDHDDDNEGMYPAADDPEYVLQKALRQFHQDTETAEVVAAVVREERARIESEGRNIGSAGAMAVMAPVLSGQNHGTTQGHVSAMDIMEDHEEHQVHQDVPQTHQLIPNSGNGQPQQQRQQQHIQSAVAPPAPMQRSQLSSNMQRIPSRPQRSAISQQRHVPSPPPSQHQPRPEPAQPPVPAPAPTPQNNAARFMGNNGGLNLAPIDSQAPAPVQEQPVRCPFCINNRMLKSIKQAVEHMSSHVEV